MGRSKGIFIGGSTAQRVLAVAIALMMLVPVGSILPVWPVGSVEAKGEVVTIASPNGGETLDGATSTKITFTTSGTGGVVVFSYSTDGGLTYPNPIGTATNAGGSQLYAWDVSNNIDSDKVRLQAEWRSQDRPPFMVLATDESDANFTVRPIIDLRFTEVPTDVTYGRYFLVRWDCYDHKQKVDHLELQARYRTDGSWGGWITLGGVYADIPPTEGGTWWMPYYHYSAHGQLRIRAIARTGSSVLAEAISDEFTINSPWIVLTKPNGGEVMVSGTYYTIEWATANDPTGIIIGAALDYSLNGGADWASIALSTANDGSHDWLVPSGDFARVRIRATALYGEWQPLASDESDGDCRIISDPNTLTVTLLDPNPYIPGGLVVRGGESHTIRWSTTGDRADVKQFRIYLSTDDGRTYTSILGATNMAGSRSWTAPEVDTYLARVRIDLVRLDDTTTSSASVNPFYIFTNIAWNRPPEAWVVEHLDILEGETVTLDGTASSDPDGDPITYQWTQTDHSGFDAALSGATTASPTFIPSIRDFEVTYIFQLVVSDGEEPPMFYVGHIAFVTVTVTPSGPSISDFYPKAGWEGMLITINGTNLMGAQILIGGVLTGTVATSPTTDIPDPDTQYNFTIMEGVPHLPGAITVSTRVGEATSAETLDVYPLPWYCLDWGFNWWSPPNPSKDYLSYPWAFWDDGNYHDTFGDDVYISLWICIGIPVWTPWTGWYCLGYEIDQPIAPDPLAALWYGVAYCYLAQHGECFGCSAMSLAFYRDKIQPQDVQPGVYNIDDLVCSGDLRRRIDYMHGSQVSAECLRLFIAEHIGNLVPSIEGMSGMGMVLSGVRDSVSSGKLGVISMVEGTSGHIVVPYEVVDVDSTHTRIYVWDINRPQWSTLPSAQAQLGNTDDRVNHPPYIEIDRSGLYWEWSYYMGGDAGWWGGAMGMTFVPSDVILGDRSLPTTVDGAYALVFGSATGSVEDADGNEMAVHDDGTVVMDIPEASPIWFHEGAGSPFYGAYYLPAGNFTTHIDGREAGPFNWTVLSGTRAAYAIEGEASGGSTEDTVVYTERDGNPYMGVMAYGSSDEEKPFSATQVKKFETRQRVYKVIDATIFDDTEIVINTTDDYNALVIRNDGPHTFTFDVEFQGNVLSSDGWNRSGTTLTGLPTARRSGITIGPHETLVIRPTNWLDLLTAEIVIDGEAPPAVVPGVPRDLATVNTPDGVAVSWAPPLDDGGSPVTGYIVKRGATEADLATITTVENATSYLDTGVERGKRYYYAVVAVNSVGEGTATEASSLDVPLEPGGDGDDDGGLPWIVILLVVLVVAIALGVAYSLASRKEQAPPDEGRPPT